jgi:hypothetical protein
VALRGRGRWIAAASFSLALGLVVGRFAGGASPAEIPTVAPAIHLSPPAEGRPPEHANSSSPSPSAASPTPADPSPAAAERDPAPAVEDPTPAQESRAEAPVDPHSSASSWVVPLELGWHGASAGTPIHVDVPYRPARPHPSDLCFLVRVTDAAGHVSSANLPVRGLLPFELADGRDDHAVGDQLFLARAPVLLRLPDVTLPARVELFRPDGVFVATFDLSHVGGAVVIQVR